MRIYKAPQTISIPTDLNLTELLHTSNDPPLPLSHLIAKDSLTNRSITIGELRQRAGWIANGLKSTVSPHDQSRWAVILPNSVEYLEVFHAVLWLGGVVCPINHAIKAGEIGHAFAVTRPDFVVAYGPVVAKVLEAVEMARRELTAEGVAWSAPKILTVVESMEGYKHIPDDFLSQEKLAIPHWNDTKR
jgi:acyl-CoA synthetase (AMP-forming)/AMP-acid ligase II